MSATEKTTNLKPVYYWLDGYWIYDKEEADLMDEINAFGSLHGTAYFQADADQASVDTGVKSLLAGQGAKTICPPLNECDHSS